MYKYPNITHFASELDYEIYDEKYNTLTAEDIIHFYGLDESDFEEYNNEDELD